MDDFNRLGSGANSAHDNLKNKEVSKNVDTKLDLSKIVQHKFSEREYFKEVYPKKQIVLHHTVSGNSVNGDINWWLKDGKRIGTCVLIARDGTIHQVFSSKYWAYHLGENGKDHQKVGLPYQRNDMKSIGIEIDSWGGLKFDTSINEWRSSTGTIVPKDRVEVYDKKFRGYSGFEKYTPEQIESVRQLLVYWGKVYDIPLDYNDCMWNISKKALSGWSGIFSHVSFRSDKSDAHRQPELIEMLKSLK